MENLVEQKFGRLTVQEFAGMSKNRHSRWNCLCDCGNTARVERDHLKSGNTQSCGCYNKEQVSKAKTIHGQNKNGLITKEYKCWQDMKDRCYNPNDEQYKDYGGRGIKVCERWLNSFENFYTDMGNRPIGMTLDRKDNDGDYCPENCRWCNWVEQHNNKRSNVWYECKGERKTISQWARSLGVSYDVLRYRLNNSASIEQALGLV